MRSSRFAQVLAGACLVAAAVGGTTVAVAQDGGGGRSPEALVDRLVELENELPELPPSAVVLDDETTWGQLQGDFVSAQLELELLSEAARTLFIEADDVNGPVAQAVADVARSYVDLERAYARLAAYEDAGLGEAAGTTDADDVATGRDEAVALAETGLAQLVDARTRAMGGYLVLRDAAEADDAEKALFDAAYRATERFLDEDVAQLHELLSLRTRSLAATTDRFTTPAPGTQARARSMTIVCFDRGSYPLGGTLTAEDAAALTVDDLQGDSVDCPDFDNDNVVAPSTGG